MVFVTNVSGEFDWGEGGHFTNEKGHIENLSLCLFLLLWHEKVKMELNTSQLPVMG